MEKKRSPEAAARLLEQINSGRLDLDDESGETDCSEGCQVESHGCCSHGFESAWLTAERVTESQ